jgi:hypothetical protein
MDRDRSRRITTAKSVEALSEGRSWILTAPRATRKRAARKARTTRSGVPRATTSRLACASGTTANGDTAISFSGEVRRGVAKVAEVRCQASQPSAIGSRAIAGVMARTTSRPDTSGPGLLQLRAE